MNEEEKALKDAMVTIRDFCIKHVSETTLEGCNCPCYAGKCVLAIGNQPWAWRTEERVVFF